MDKLIIQEEIGGLADLDLISLRSRWLDVYGCEAPMRMSRELVIRKRRPRPIGIEVAGGLDAVVGW